MAIASSYLGFLVPDHARARVGIRRSIERVQMPMPTTRRGRFLFYRDRAMRRRRKVWRRRQHYSAVGNDGWKMSGSRTRDLTGYFIKQVPVTDYRPVPPVLGLVIPDAAWLVKPERGVWGVLELLDVWRPFKPNSHAPFARRDYAKRRVWYTPRLANLPFVPFVAPYDPTRPELYYPFEFYPSGRVNPHFVP